MSEIRMKPYNRTYGDEWDRIFGKKESKIACDERQENVDIVITTTPLYDEDAVYSTIENSIDDEKNGLIVRYSGMKNEENNT